MRTGTLPLRCSATDKQNHFAAFDFNTDGKLTMKELAQGFEVLGSSPLASMYKAAFAKVFFGSDLAKVTSKGDGTLRHARQRQHQQDSPGLRGLRREGRAHEGPREGGRLRVRLLRQPRTVSTTRPSSSRTATPRTSSSPCSRATCCVTNSSSGSVADRRSRVGAGGRHRGNAVAGRTVSRLCSRPLVRNPQGGTYAESHRRSR
jgi:hypothetical protein